MDSQYNKLLEEAKLKGSNLAKDYIPRMYKELVEVEELDPHDAGERIKKDLVDTWSRTTIYENLPEEAKQEIKIEAGKQSHKNVLEVSATNFGADSSITNDPKSEVPWVAPIYKSERDNNKYLGDVLDQYKEREQAQKQDYDKLAEEYNEAQEKLEGVESHNEYLQNEIEQLKEAVTALQTAGANQLVQATSKVQPQARNPNRGYWCKFDLSNIELTRPLINIIMRMKDRPKQFFIEVLGDEVIEVSESKQ